MSGYDARTNELGIRAIRIHYSAATDKNPNHPDPAMAEAARLWLRDSKQKYPDPHQWAQEMEINWWIAAGTRVYPEFTEALHVWNQDSFIDYKVLYRAWDFGWHAPACLIGQLDRQDRLILHREIIGKAQTTKEFAQEVIHKCNQWFPNIDRTNRLQRTAGYIDYCDPAGQKVEKSASERSEVRDVEILNALGIHPSWEYGWSRKDGRALVHQLLLPRLDGTPSMYTNAIGCPVLVQGFLGKYVYPAKRGGMAHDEPDENNHPWADVQACLRYLATGLYSALGLRRPTRPAEPETHLTYHGYGTRKR